MYHLSCPLLCLNLRYHYFKIEVPSGTPLVIRKEDNMYDPFVFGFFIPVQTELIPEASRDVQLYSKSQ